MKHYRKWHNQGAYCGEELPLTSSGLNWSRDITGVKNEVTCLECLSRIETDVIWLKAYKEKKRLGEVAPDLLKALEFYSIRMSFNHMDGECSLMCKDEGDVARDAIERVKSS